MTEAEWLGAKNPYSCQEIIAIFGSTRKLRLLMLSFIEPLEELFTAQAGKMFLKLREWAEDESKSIERDKWHKTYGRFLRDDGVSTNPRGIAAEAVGYFVFQASALPTRDDTGIRPRNNNDHALSLREPAAKAARAMVLRNVGNSPPGVTITHPSFVAWDCAWQKEWKAQKASQADLMRCIYGNPFRPVALDHRWATATCVDLARSIDAARQFHQMPILADALMDAGCDSEEILNHCRSSQRHARGCWVIDLLSGKSCVPITTSNRLERPS